MSQSSSNTISEEDQADILKKYLSDRGYNLGKIPEGTSKTPDFEITKADETYLCELKAPELIIDKATNMFIFKTTISKLLRFVLTAIKQLETHDPNHEKPWIIVFESCHFQLHYKSLTDALQGGVVFNGGFNPDFTKTAVYHKALEEMSKIDLFIWLQVNANERLAYRASYIQHVGSKHKTKMEALTDTLFANKLGTMNMDNVIVLPSLG